MKIDVFCEVEKAREVWGPNHEYQLLKETLAQAQLADKAGFDCWWEVEHHTALEMSYSSAPEVLLTAIAARTNRMRIGHSVVLAPFNHPIRIAERTATLDLISDGRLEVGLGRSTIPEWRLFNVDPEQTREQLQELMRALPGMWTSDSFSLDGKYLQVKNANLIPKPLQKPHPPMWQAATTQDSFVMAGQNGVGILGVTLMTPLETMAGLLKSYRDALKDCEPAGHYVNEQTGVFTFVHVAETTRKAIENGAGEAVAWYVNTINVFFELAELRKKNMEQIKKSQEAGAGLRGQIDAPAADEEMSPERKAALDLIQRMADGEQLHPEEVYEVLSKQDSVIIGDPETCRRKMAHYRDIGVDSLLCFQQVGALQHEHIMDSIRLTGEHIVPYFSPK